MHRTTGTPTEVSPESVLAWDSLVRQHSPGVFRHAYRLTGNRADAEDITQEVFVRAMRSPDAGTSGAVEGWFHRVTLNLFVDMLRRRGRTRSVPIDERPWAREPADTAPEPADEALRGALDPDLEAALAGLPAAFREAVLLCDVHGLSYAEIGRVVDAKPGTVRSRIHRGRAMLRRELAHRAPVPGCTRHRGAPDESPAPRAPSPVVGTSGTMTG